MSPTHPGLVQLGLDSPGKVELDVSQFVGDGRVVWQASCR